MAATKTAPKTEKTTAPKAKKVQFNWTEPRKAIIKAMKILHCFSGGEAKTAAEIAEKANIPELTVKFYGYKTEKLTTEGYINHAKLEGTNRLGYYLTAKGRKVVIK